MRIRSILLAPLLALVLASGAWAEKQLGEWQADRSYIAGFLAGLHSLELIQLGEAESADFLQRAYRTRVRRDDSMPGVEQEVGFCLPKGVAKAELVEKAYQYIAAQPEQPKRDTFDIVYSAFKHLYPCGGS